MADAYAQDIFGGYILQGNLKDALAYLDQFPEKAALYERYVKRFAEEPVLSEQIDPELDEILVCYQKYYRDVFYLELDAAEAEARLRGRLETLLGAEGAALPDEPDNELDAVEEWLIAPLFREKGYFFLGGRTSGYYGPYVWKTEELKQYSVELPDGTQEYAVKLLDGFLSRSWVDYLTFGEIGTGGWTGGDGLIHCVRSAYDLESEDFRVSLLKHEAQHAQDLARYGQMSSADLEYRAKLVELIYSAERNLLRKFALQANDSHTENGHAAAASRMAAGFEMLLHCSRGAFGEVPIPQIQAAARELFAQSTRDTARKYLSSKE